MDFKQEEKVTYFFLEQHNERQFKERSLSFLITVFAYCPSQCFCQHAGNHVTNKILMSSSKAHGSNIGSPNDEVWQDRLCTKRIRAGMWCTPTSSLAYRHLDAIILEIAGRNSPASNVNSHMTLNSNSVLSRGSRCAESFVSYPVLHPYSPP